MNNLLIKKLKSAKVIKEKKWIYNLCAYTISVSNDEDCYRKLQRQINIYYLQHYKSYFSEIYQKLSPKKKIKYKKNVLSKKSTLEYQRELQRKQRAVYKLFMEGKLSPKSSEIISDEL